MAVTREEIIEALKEMSLLEAAELVKDIEETFGVSAAAPVAVAAAAPGRPRPRTPTNKRSSVMLVSPAATVTVRPRWGRSATTKKLWNTFCSMKGPVDSRRMRP